MVLPSKKTLSPRVVPSGRCKIIKSCVKSTRKVALFIFAISVFSSLLTIIHTHRFYPFNNNSNDSNKTSGIPSTYTALSLSIDENDDTTLQPDYWKIRKKAISKAKEESKKWQRLHERDDGIKIDLVEAYQEAIDELAREEQKELERKEAEKEEIESESSYYFYYQDNNDQFATVVGLPFESQSSSDPIIFKRFIGSLRSTGFSGNIIIGIEKEQTNEKLVDYLTSQNVTVKRLLPVPCTFIFAETNQKCYHPYSHIKKEWSYFPLARDWLTSCEECVGAVVVASVKDTFFQLNPFGQGMPIVSRLHLYEQQPSIDAERTSAGVLLKACENIDLASLSIDLEKVSDDVESNDPIRLRILSAGTALGTRDDVIDYLSTIHSVMREWMQRSQCHFEHSTLDDGMAIVNYLRIIRRLPYRTRIIPHRTGIVNNVGYDGLKALEAHLHFWQFKGLSVKEAENMPYEGAQAQGKIGWIDTEYLLTDNDGYFIDVFFKKSAIIHEYNTFGPPFISWLDKSLNLTDTDTDTDTDVDTEVQLLPKSEDGKDTPINKTLLDMFADHAKNAVGGVDDKNTASGLKDSTNNQTATQKRSRNKNNEDDDDFYIKYGSTTLPNNSTIRNFTTHAATNLLSNNSTQAEVAEKKKKEQPMYYKDPSDDNDNDDGKDKDDNDLLSGMDGDDDDDDDDNDDVITDQKNTPVVPVEETHSIAEGDADGDDEEKKRENGEEESETALLDETNEKREKKMRPIRTRGSGRNGR